jgi:hypothetical protein
MMTPGDFQLSRGRFFVRVAWIAVQLVLVYYLGHSDNFFYQGF